MPAVVTERSRAAPAPTNMRAMSNDQKSCERPEPTAASTQMPIPTPVHILTPWELLPLRVPSSHLITSSKGLLTSELATSADGADQACIGQYGMISASKAEMGRTNQAKWWDLVSQLSKDDRCNHQSDHKYSCQHSQLKLAQIKVSLQGHNQSVSYMRLFFTHCLLISWDLLILRAAYIWMSFSWLLEGLSCASIGFYLPVLLGSQQGLRNPWNSLWLHCLQKGHYQTRRWTWCCKRIPASATDVE